VTTPQLFVAGLCAALVIFVGLLADLAIYRAYPEIRDWDWGWLVSLYRRARRALTQRRHRRSTANRPGHV